ncbi:MAG: diphthine synthase [Thermoplasmata archaeon]|nr:diphthine synthase [Thermoplasmata archaeon]
MAELWFVGAGLADERDISRRGREALERCDVVFAEEYTAVLAPGSVERLAQELRRPITRIDRTSLESGRPIMEALAEGRRVGLLVVGDPFAATTHVALRVDAEKAGHTWRYVPNASVLSAAASFLGLMHYRFGRTVSLPFPEPGFAPASPVEFVRKNRAEGLHSLVLLDLRPLEGRFLRAHEAIAILKERDAARSLFVDTLEMGVVARVGADDAAAWWRPLAVLERIDFGAPLHCLVVPAPELHFEEQAAIECFRVR